MSGSEKAPPNGMPSQSTGKEWQEKASSEDLSDSDDADANDNDNYTDVENDVVELKIVSLFDNEVFDNVPSMLEYVRLSYNFDLVGIKNQLGRCRKAFLYSFEILLFPEVDHLMHLLQSISSWPLAIAAHDHDQTKV